MDTLSRTDAFTSFARDAGERVRRALIATYGPELGIEATADALEYGWEHWDRIRAMDNPDGYLYRVGRTKARMRLRKRRPVLPRPDQQETGRWYEPGLPDSLARLTNKQRAAVVLVHGYGYTYQEAADPLGSARSTVQQHVERGLARLRQDLGVTDA